MGRRPDKEEPLTSLRAHGTRRRTGAPAISRGVRLNVDRLRREMAYRGLSGADLARLAGVSATTVSAAMLGRPVAPGTLRRIAIALSRVPLLPGGEHLLAGQNVGSRVGTARDPK